MQWTHDKTDLADGTVAKISNVFGSTLSSCFVTMKVDLFQIDLGAT